MYAPWSRLDIAAGFAIDWRVITVGLIGPSLQEILDMCLSNVSLQAHCGAHRAPETEIRRQVAVLAICAQARRTDKQISAWVSRVNPSTTSMSTSMSYRLEMITAIRMRNKAFRDIVMLQSRLHE